MAEPLCLRLSGAVLPSDINAARRHVRAKARRSAHYLERYDRKTLFYDCVYHDETEEYLFTAPRFLNLWPQFRDRLRLDGAPVTKLKRRTSGKYEQVRVRAPKAALSLDWPGGTLPLPPRADVASQFEGRNCVMTLNKDNDLGWIRDWLSYLVAAHGLQAVLIFDNGSTRYSPEALAETIAAVPGIEAACVAVADYPYGPRDSGKGFEVRPKFLQPALLNLARTDMLRRARAVLNVDIDEIVLRRDGASVFDRAQQHWSKSVCLQGYWAYPDREAPVPTGHRAHRFRAQPNKGCNRKWCAVPDQGLSRLGWFVHHVGGELFRLVPPSRPCDFVHCRGTSTGWKGTRFRWPDQIAPDPELEALMSRYFPQEPRS